MNQPNQDIQLTDKEIVLALTNIKRGRGKKGMGPAQHKPLLLLFLLGRYWHNSNRLLLFRNVRYPFEDFLRKFSGNEIHREAAMLPVWHMNSENYIWSLQGEEQIKNWVLRNGEKERPNIQDAMYRPFYFGLSPYVYNRIINDKVLLLRLIFELLNKYFPKNNSQYSSETHLRILRAIGIPIVTWHGKMQNILRVYKYSCSVCGYRETEFVLTYNLHIVNINTVLASRGFDNSIVMCEKHRALFDFGAFTIDHDEKILIADSYKEEDNSKDLLAFEKSRPYLPASPSNRPSKEYLAWHKENKFDQPGLKLL